MVRLPDPSAGGTGAGGNSTATTSKDGRERGRRLALDLILEKDSGPSVAADGGLSPAARAWMDATPGADVEDARKYDREQQIHREISRIGPLPPRGEPGHPSNYDRAEQVNTARKALRDYHELEEQAETGDR